MKKEDVVTMANKLIQQHGKVTVRQIYYQLYPKFHEDYRNARSFYSSFDRILVSARENKAVPVDKIIDTARQEMGGDSGFRDPYEFLREQVESFLRLDASYSRNRWRNQPVMPVVWVEKDALSRIVHGIASRYKVMTCPSRGYTSVYYLWNIVDKYPKIKILHFADHDPSGIDMTRDIKKRVSKYAENDIAVERVALTRQQVKKYNLVSNPTKRVDSRRKGYVKEFGDRCWELDALPPAELEGIVRDSIVKEIDVEVWDKTVRQESKDKEEVRKNIGKVEEQLKGLVGI